MTTKFLALFIFIYSCCGAALAQQAPKGNVNIGLVYPLSTNGVHAWQCSNWFSANALAGISASENAFCVAGISNTIKDSANGLIAAGVVNVIGGNAMGLQAAGLVNVVKGNVIGLQTSGFLNICGGLKGMQNAGFCNIARENVIGLQSAGFCNIARRNVLGVQYAGFINKARNVNLQFAGFVNVADSVVGGQFAGFNNTATGRVLGVQAAGFSNEAQNVHTQLAGFINTARDVDGAQVAGFINVARKVKGVQIAGFINVADSSDYPIGIINVIKKGEKAIGVSVDETGTTMATFRSGGRVLYGMVGAGINNYKGDGLYAIGAGIGAHMVLSKHFRINFEAALNTLTGFNRNYFINTGIRIYPAVSIGRIELFGGPSFNYGAYSNRIDPNYVGNALWSGTYRNYRQDVHVGFIAGLQVRL